MTGQLDASEKYQIKKQSFLRKILRRMFRMVDRVCSPRITSQSD